MKGWTVQHKGKRHKILDVVDTGKPAHEPGGGNVYHLEGLDKPVHQSTVSDPQPPENKMKKADQIKGGRADSMKPTQFDQKQLAIGTKHEMEHTSDRALAREIAMDHLAEDPEYYNKLKEVEKYDRVETTADGKTELDHGAEDLNKLKGKWNKLKKALNADAAIMDLTSQEGDDDEDDMAQGEEAAPADAGEEAPDSGEQEEADQGEEQADVGSAEEEIAQALRDDGYDEAEIAHIIHGHGVPIPTKDDHAADNEAVKGQIQQKAMTDKHEIEQRHREEAHQQERRQDEIEHGMNTEHKKRMHDIEYEKAKADLDDPEVLKAHKKKLLEIEAEIESSKKDIAKLEVEHKKRMQDLEYEKAQREANKEDPTDDIKREQMKFEMEMKRMEKQLELEFKKKELALKLKLTEEAARQKAEHAKQQAEADAAVNAQVKEHQAKHKIAEAKKPPEKDNGKAK